MHCCGKERADGVNTVKSSGDGQFYEDLFVVSIDRDELIVYELDCFSK